MVIKEFLPPAKNIQIHKWKFRSSHWHTRPYTIPSLLTYLFNFSCYYSPSYGAWWQKDWPSWYLGNVLARVPLQGLSHFFSVCLAVLPKIPSWFTPSPMLDLYSKIYHVNEDSPVYLGKIMLPKLQILSVWASFSLTWITYMNLTLL